MSPPDVAGSGAESKFDSRRDEIHVPGSAASSFNGCGILHSLLWYWQFAPCDDEATGSAEKFVHAWAEVSLITPEIMGRISAKVESLETMLMQ